MLNAMRRGSKTIFAKILIGILVMGFALWGVSGFVNQIDPTEVARVGNTQVSAAEFVRRYERARANTSQQIGRNLTADEAAALGVPNQVLQAMVTDALQVDAAHALGIDLGDDTLAERIREDEAFQGPGGDFDRVRFDYLMSENRYTENEYIELERHQAAREMLVNGLLGGLSAPQTYVKALNRFQNQTRTISYFVLTDAALGPADEPTEEELRAYFEENKADFRSPEYRTLTAVSLTAADIADPEAVDDEDVKQAYEREGAYGQPERRHVQQVVLADKAAAESAAERLESGENFETVLTDLERSFADVDLGLVTRAELVDPAVAEAAFGLDVNGVAVVDGRFGPVLVRVSEIEEAGKQPLDDVDAQIRRDIALGNAARELRTVTDTIEDEFAGGASVAEVAERFDLPTVSATVDENGRDQDGNDVAFGVAEPAVFTAFTMDVGEDPRRVRGADERVWVQLDTVIEAADRPYEEVADDVRAAFIAERDANRLGDKAKEALAAVDDGKSVEEVAAEFGVTATTSNAFSRAEAPAGVPAGVAAAAFEGGLGHTGDVIAGAGRHVIFKVSEINEPVFFADAADLQPITQTLNDGLANSLLFAMVQAWQSEVGAEVNEPVFLAATGRGDDPRLQY